MWRKIVVSLMIVGLLIGTPTISQAAHVKGVYWDGLLMVKGQVGKVKVIKPINLWQRVGDKLVFSRILKPGEQYRVYRYDNKFGGQYGLGGGYYITNMAGFIEYKTPSKRKLAELEALYPTMPGKVTLSNGEVTSQLSKKVAPGVTETSLAVNHSRGKQQIHVLDFNPSIQNMSMQTSLAKGQLFGLETVSSQAKNNSSTAHTVIGGVNGDYFDSNGTPIDLMMQNGEILATSRTPLDQLAVFGVKANGYGIIGSPEVSLNVSINGQTTYKIDSINRIRSANHLVVYTPHFSTTTRTNQLGTEVILTNLSGSISGNGKLTGTVAEVQIGKGSAALSSGQVILSGHHLASDYLKTAKPGDQIEISSSFTDPKWHDVKEAIGGRYRLVSNGNVVKWDITGAHPRTAIGIKRDGKIFTLVVDGRSTTSVGMTLSELAVLMKDLGAVDAMTFDGGGSSTLVARQAGEQNVSVVNKPSDGFERSVANSLLFISKWAVGPLHELIVNPSEVTLFAGATYNNLNLSVKGVDVSYNPVALSNPATITSPVFASVTNGIYKIVDTPTEAQITAKSGSITNTVKAKVVNTLEKIDFKQPDIMINKNETITLTPNGIVGGKVIVTDPTIYIWNVSNNIGTVSKTGVFTAGTKDGIGTITATAGGVTSTINVTVGVPENVVLADFEKGIGNWTASGARYNTATIELATDQVKFGVHSLKINYDFTGTSGTSGVYAGPSQAIAISGQPKKIGMWVYGDGQGHWLRSQLRDKNGQEVHLDFTKNLDWVGWKYVEAVVPTTVAYPVSLEMPVRYMETNDANKNAGTIYIDHIQAIYK
ncbi:phosphodiester glycosidase family protein [Bacillus luteolus]|uniref:Phosphodiester glycosidase family protein n=1 Tax=Litchfieldia luteola TaxID=682179 RepID=A0ABR9QFA3_9BACI|nr:phosphodiester glycosidase family protein [Cytobacillus luteolus]MBE4907096.1 phosphodiester glycosidase family protein [Cytobacillus luteolus]MBP1943437.1 exopolysaccharide biosynthesis protein [Cytobacillus luteolus]